MAQALSSQLIPAILQHIREQPLAPGARLSERSLAAVLRVSRSPVRAALQLMEKQRLVDHRDDGGFVVAVSALNASTDVALAMPALEQVYLRIAQDRLEGSLPERVSGNELMRRYGVSRSQLTEILARVVREGWMERLPGHGWAFTEIMNSAAAYEQAYRFRILVEPAGLLEPGYTLDRQALIRCREEQAELAAGAVREVSPAHIFDANTRLHETIARGSGNAFIIDALGRLNRVRRLMEYRKAVDREQALRRCEEHLALIDLLLAGRLEQAANYLQAHLRGAARDKQALLPAVSVPQAPPLGRG